MSKKVHFIGNNHVARAACGRMVLSWREDAPRWTTDPKGVTCLACLKVMTDVVEMRNRA